MQKWDIEGGMAMFYFQEEQSPRKPVKNKTMSGSSNRNKWDNYALRVLEMIPLGSLILVLPKHRSIGPQVVAMVQYSLNLIQFPVAFHVNLIAAFQVYQTMF